MQTTGTCASRPCSPAFAPDAVIPVWMYLQVPKDADRLPRAVTSLNLRLVERYAPPPRFVIRVLNRTSAAQAVRLPVEWPLCTDEAAFSDMLRTAVLAQYGGIWLDSDVIVNQPLERVVQDLQVYDLVSYASANQPCRHGAFSSNFVAARPGTDAYRQAFSGVEAVMRRVCYKGGALRSCRVPWAELGERILHPITRNLTAHNRLSIKCFSGDESFTPGFSRVRELNMFRIYTVSTNASSSVWCRRDHLDLQCRRGQTINTIHRFFDRIAYHTFHSLFAKRYARQHDDIVLGTVYGNAFRALQSASERQGKDGLKHRARS